VYLNQYKKELENRSDIRSSKSKWFELRACHYYNIFESNKIITPKMGLTNSFTIDNGMYFCLDSCFEIVLHNNEENDTYLKFILGLLNSKTLEFYFKQIGTFVRDRWYIYHMQYLVQLPIVEMKKSKQLANQLIKKVNKILQLNKQINLIEEILVNFPLSFVNTKGEKLLNIAKSFPIKFSKGIYRFSKKNLEIETVREIMGETSYRLQITKKEHFTFRTLNEARYVQKLLRKKGKVTKSALIALGIPSKNELDKIMSQYDQDVKRMKEIEESVQKLEDEIDELVYKLYGLDSVDKKIIEEYLS
jgi:hypothetical protein